MNYESRASARFVRAFEFIERHRRKMLALHFAWFCLSAWLAPKFLTYGNDQVSAPKHSKAEVAEKQFELHFPEMAFELPDIVLFQCVENEGETQYAETKGCALLDHADELRAASERIVAKALDFNSTHGNIAEVQGYFQYAHTLMDGVADSFLSADGKLTFINFACKGDAASNVRYEFLTVLEDAIDEEKLDFVTMRLTGFDAMLHASISTTQGELEKIDAITVPLAMILLALMIRSWRLLLIAGLNMVVSIAGGFGLLVSLMNTFISARPENSGSQLTQVMIMAVSIDYSLFLLRRYRDELKDRPEERRRAVFISLSRSGHVILMSGATIVVVFAGFAILPAEIIQMDGVCCALGVMFAMLTCLTITPALLLEFPLFFSNFSVKPFSPRWGYESQVSSGNYVELSAQKTHARYDSFRFRFTKKITAWPFNLVAILFLYACVVPLFYEATKIAISQDVLGGVPRGSPSSSAYTEMTKHFPAGLFAPFYLIAVPSENENIKSEEFFKATQLVADAVYDATVARHPDFAKSNIASPSYLNGVKISWGEAKTLLQVDQSFVCRLKRVPLISFKACSAAREFAYLWHKSVDTSKHSAMLIQIIVPFFPFSTASHDFIYDVYDVIDDEDTDATFYLSGFEVAFDSVEVQVYGLFPYMLLGVSVCVFSLLGLLLKSAFVPVRLVLTLVLPIGAVFGIGVLVYQKGVLEWTGIAALSRIEGNAFFYYVPILISSISMGLALDYDVLLISRVMEHRHAGYDVRAAITKATCETGSLISVAGLIMVLCFGGWDLIRKQ